MYLNDLSLQGLDHIVVFLLTYNHSSKVDLVDLFSGGFSV